MASKGIKFDAWKLPVMFLGGLIGIVLGGIVGGMFGDLGYVSSVDWEAVLIFLGALAGAFVGYNTEL